MNWSLASGQTADTQAQNEWIHGGVGVEMNSFDHYFIMDFVVVVCLFLINCCSVIIFRFRSGAILWLSDINISFYVHA